MCSLDEKTILSVSLGFNNEVVKVTADHGCLLLKEIFERVEDEEDEVKIDQNSHIFKTYILGNKSFEDDEKLDFECMFQILGYFGATEKLKDLTIAYQRFYREEYYDRKSVRELFEKRLEEKGAVKFEGIWERNENVDGKMIEKYKSKKWDDIIQNTNIDLDFIYRNSDGIIDSRNLWKTVSSSYITLEYIKGLGMGFLGFDWIALWQNDKISEKTFEEIVDYTLIHYPDDILWSTLLKNPVITEKFIKNYFLNKEKFDFEKSDYKIKIVFCNPNISEEFILEMFSKYGYIKYRTVWAQYIARNENLSQEFFETLEEEGKLPNYDCELFWTSLCLNKRINCTFIEDRMDQIDYDSGAFWDNIVVKKNLELWFVEKYIDSMDWYLLCQNPIIEDIFEKYVNSDIIIGNDEDYWESLCGNNNISESFFRKYENNIKWDILSQNSGLNEKFFEHYKDHVNWEILFENTFRLKHNIDYSKAPLYKYMSK